MHEHDVVQIVDFETTTIESKGRVSNPFDYRNKIIVAASKIVNPATTYVTVRYDREGFRDWLPDASTSVLVGHNIKFDLSYIWHNPGLRDWLRTGGRIFDTMVAEYLLSAQYKAYPSLDYCAQKYGGTVKDDQVKALWQAGIDTPDIDPDILLPYARLDILNTEIVYLNQLQLIKKFHMETIIDIYMDHLLALIDMEYNGVAVDLERLQEKETALNEAKQRQFSELQAMVDQICDASGEEHFEFNPGSSDHVSAVLFNTPVTVKTYYEDGVYGPKAKKAGDPKIRIRTREVRLQGYGVPRGCSTKHKNKDVWLSNDEILQSILKTSVDRSSALERFITTLLDYRNSIKMMSVYITGMKDKVYPSDRRIHHTLDTVSAVTGRVNASNPNMQNVPKDYRDIFTSRYKDGQLIEFDYSQLEIVLSAFLTQSEKMIADVTNGVDFHMKRAAYAAEVSYEEAIALREKDPQGWGIRRQQAKGISYAKAYGAGVEKISESTGLPIATVEKVLAAEDRDYPEVAEFSASVLDEIMRSRVPTQDLIKITLKDENRRKIGVDYREGEYQGIGYYQSFTGKRYHFLEHATDSPKLQRRGFGIHRYFKSTEIANYPVQGLAADLVAMFVGRLFRRVLLWEGLHPNMKLVNEVHDSVLIDMKGGLWTSLCTQMAMSVLTDTAAAFEENWGMKFNVPLGVDCKADYRWGCKDE